MIGVKPKKKKVTNPPDAPDISLEIGQAAIYGKVTAESVDGSQSALQDVEVAIFQNGNLIVFAITSEEGLYQTSAINAGDNYTMEFTKESTILIPEFSLASKQVKQVNVEFSNTNN